MHSRKVNASQKWLLDQYGFHPKVYDSQMYMPTKSDCQEEEKRLPAKLSCRQKLANSQEWMTAVKITFQKK